MRILTVHTKYRLKGGEDNVYAQEQLLLKDVVEVRSLTFENAGGISGLFQFFYSIWNVSAALKIKKEIDSFKPDIIHFHNVHFAIGPYAIRLAKKSGIKVIMTLHNYRLLCPSAILLHNGEIFEDSVRAFFPWKAIKNRVYHGSFILTFWLALVTWLHRRMGTWSMVDQFWVLTESAKHIFVNSSLNITEAKFFVKQNFVERLSAVNFNRQDHDSYLFIGRLNEEKGLKVLLQSFISTKRNVMIAGDGPLKSYVEDIVKTYPNITFLGNLNKTEIISALSQCSALVFPSIWYEGMPMTILEALSTATPVIASNIGAMSSIIENKINGLHFEAGNEKALSETLSYWESLTTAQRAEYYNNAINSYTLHYTPEANRERMLELYIEASKPI
jgi:glycosyltransferase involved in cell wall biosynthesis